MKYFINLDFYSENRFDMGRFLEYTDNYDPLNSSLFNDITSLQLGGRYTVSGEDGRPDLLSYRIYDSAQYWWVILLYNNILDYDQIKTGDVINYPLLNALEEFYFSLRSKELAAQNTV